MKTYNLKLKTEDIDRLTNLIGKTWDHYGSQTLFNEGTLAASDMFLATSSSSISVLADFVLLDFEEGTDEFSFLRFENGEIGLTAARRNGNLYFDFRGSQISNVFIIRDTVTMFDQILEDRELVVDSGFVIETTTGSIGICKGSFYMADMFIQKFEANEPIELFDSNNEWESSLHRRFTITRRVLPIDEVSNQAHNYQ